MRASLILIGGSWSGIEVLDILAYKGISQWVYGAMGTRSRDLSDDDGRSAWSELSADLLCFVKLDSMGLSHANKLRASSIFPPITYLKLCCTRPKCQHLLLNWPQSRDPDCAYRWPILLHPSRLPISSCGLLASVYTFDAYRVLLGVSFSLDICAMPLTFPLRFISSCSSFTRNL